jgi:hypothetical protein
MGSPFLQARCKEGADFLQTLFISIREDRIAAAAGKKKGGKENGLKRFVRVGTLAEKALDQFTGLPVPAFKIRGIKGSLLQAINLRQLSLQAGVILSALLVIIYHESPQHAPLAQRTRRSGVIKTYSGAPSMLSRRFRSPGTVNLFREGFRGVLRVLFPPIPAIPLYREW